MSKKNDNAKKTCKSLRELLKEHRAKDDEAKVLAENEIQGEAHMIVSLIETETSVYQQVLVLTPEIDMKGIRENAAATMHDFMTKDGAIPAVAVLQLKPRVISMVQNSVKNASEMTSLIRSLASQGADRGFVVSVLSDPDMDDVMGAIRRHLTEH